jgi:hypothetical protein
MNIKEKIKELTGFLDHGDRGVIASRLDGIVSKMDVYNILRGVSLNDPDRTKKVIDELQFFVDEKVRMFGLC